MNTSATGLSALQFANIDGLNIRFARSDKRSAEPILLLSPWPESIYAFLPTWNAFCELGEVVAVDLPAFGQSESRADVRAPEAMGEFILRIMDAFELRTPHVVGPDVGTPALLFAAANHPGSLRSLVIGSGATDHKDITGVLDLVVNAPSFETFKDLTGEQFVRGAAANLADYELPDYVLQDYIASYAGERFFESVEFVRDYPKSLPRLAKRLHEVDVPVQITVGRDDPFVPVSNAQGLHAGLPKSRLDVLGCGHFAWEDRADEYARIAVDWINGGYLKFSHSMTQRQV